MFSFITQACKRLYDSFAAPLRTLLSRESLDEQTLDELRTLCIEADMGVATTDAFIAALRKEVRNQPNRPVSEVVHQVACDFLRPLTTSAPAHERVVMLVGVNGSGKTTTIAKLTAQARAQGKRVILVAADTFRAAAPEQLAYWAHELGAMVLTGGVQEDPATVIYRACQLFRTDGSYDLMIIDTSGRVQTKTNLMDELAKLRRVISKQLPNEPVATLITIDSMLGQNSLQQVELFNACTPLSGIILTKCDGTGKGGILFAIADRVKLPVRYVTSGEQVEAIAPFEVKSFVDSLLRHE